MPERVTTHAPPDERVGEAGHADDAARRQHHRVLDLGVEHLEPLADGGERADVAAVIRAPAPMTAGPRTWESSTTRRRPRRRPGPRSRLDPLTSPSMRGSIVSSTRRSTRAAGPSCRCRSTSPSSTSWPTRWPWSISHWMASVISSSPRADGSMARTASWMSGLEQVHADEGEVGRRHRRASRPAGRPRRRRRARPRRSAAGRAPGTAGSAQAGGVVAAVEGRARRPGARSASNRSTNPASDCWSMLSPRYMTKSSSPRKSRAMSTQWARPSGASWGM